MIVVGVLKANLIADVPQFLRPALALYSPSFLLAW